MSEITGGALNFESISQAEMLETNKRERRRAMQMPAVTAEEIPGIRS